MRRKVRLFKIIFNLRISDGLGTRNPGFGLFKSEEFLLRLVLNEAFLYFYPYLWIRYSLFWKTDLFSLH